MDNNNNNNNATGAGMQYALLIAYEAVLDAVEALASWDSQASGDALRAAHILKDIYTVTLDV